MKFEYSEAQDFSEADVYRVSPYGCVDTAPGAQRITNVSQTIRSGQTIVVDSRRTVASSTLAEDSKRNSE